MWHGIWTSSVKTFSFLKHFFAVCQISWTELDHLVFSFSFSCFVSQQVRLQVGLYIVYLIDWLTVFSREQFLILRLEDHASNRKYTMHKVFDFLSLGEWEKTWISVTQNQIVFWKAKADSLQRCLCVLQDHWQKK